MPGYFINNFNYSSIYGWQQQNCQTFYKSSFSRHRPNTFNLFSFENYYNKNVTNYFSNVGILGNYYDIADSIDFTHWLEYFTDSIIDELLRVKKLLPKVSVSPKEELMPYHRKILEFIRKKGYISDRDYKKLTNRAKATRNLDFNKLIDMGLIERKGTGKATYYQLKEKL